MSEHHEHHHHHKDAFEKEIDFMVIVSGILQYSLVFLGIAIWVLSIIAEGFYLGKYVHSVRIPLWLKMWLLPLLIFLIPILGFLVPIFVFFMHDKNVEKEMPSHLRTNSTVKAVKGAVVVLGIVTAVVAPVFLAVLINKMFGQMILIWTFGLCLALLMVLILGQMGLFARIRHYLKHRI